MRGPVSRRSLRCEVLERDNWRCIQCGVKTSEVHHVISRGRKGADRVENMVTLCGRCHRERPGRSGAHSHEARKRHLRYLRDRFGYKYEDRMFLEALEEMA